MPQIVKSKPLYHVAIVVVHHAVFRYAEHPGFDRGWAQVVGHQHISYTRDPSLLLTRSEDPIRGSSVRSFPLPVLEKTSQQRSHRDGGFGLLRLETFRNLAIYKRTL